MADISKLSLNTHYKMPWIVWKRELDFTVTDPWGHQVADIAHGLPFIPLLIGQWSTNPDFKPAYDITTFTPGYTGSGQPPFALIITADNSQIHIDMTNNTGTGNFYLRLMAYAPPDYEGEVTPVKYSSPFTFNSRYNYPKIIQFARGTAGSTINHNLGFIPQAQVWSIVTNGTGASVTPAGGVLTESTLTSSYIEDDFYYCIFGDRLL